MVVDKLFIILISVQARGTFKRVTTSSGGYGNAFLREKWSENPELTRYLGIIVDKTSPSNITLTTVVKNCLLQCISWVKHHRSQIEIHHSNLSLYHTCGMDSGLGISVCLKHRTHSHHADKSNQNYIWSRLPGTLQTVLTQYRHLSIHLRNDHPGIEIKSNS